MSDPKVLKNVTVHAGTNFLTKTGDVYNVKKVIIHPDYDPDLIRNDIGLFHLETDIVFKDVVQSIPIATTNSILVGEFCFLIGWGRLKVRNDELNKHYHERNNQSLIFSFIYFISIYMYIFHRLSLDNNLFYAHFILFLLFLEIRQNI